MIFLSVGIWVATGLLAGGVARVAMRSPRDYGLIGDLTTGCLGAVLGGWLLRRAHVLTPEDFVGHVLVALIGAAVLLSGARLLRHLVAAAGLVPSAAPATDSGNLESFLRRVAEPERQLLLKLLRGRHASRDVNATFDAQLTFGERVADRVAAFGGSWVFIGMFFAALVVWMSINEDMATPFDPYPFILLNLILSCLAAVQAPVILMSQNRQAVKDRLDARNDFEVNLRAEMQIMALHEKLDQLRTQELSNLKHLLEDQAQRLASLEQSVDAGRTASPGAS